MHDAPIPAHYCTDAEHVRAHLVHLRGGAPFLSPADTLCLVEWFDAGVPVATILAALERCVASRRKSHARTRLTLKAAGRHLGKPPLTPIRLEPTPGSHPFQPLESALQNTPDAEVAAALLALPTHDPGALVAGAVEVCRTHREQRWNDLSTEDRDTRIATAIESLGDMAHMLREDPLRELAEEIARDTFRKEGARLDTATFATLAL